MTSMVIISIIFLICSYVLSVSWNEFKKRETDEEKTLSKFVAENSTIVAIFPIVFLAYSGLINGLEEQISELEMEITRRDNRHLTASYVMELEIRQTVSDLDVISLDLEKAFQTRFESGEVTDIIYTDRLDFFMRESNELTELQKLVGGVEKPTSLSNFSTNRPMLKLALTNLDNISIGTLSVIGIFETDFATAVSNVKSIQYPVDSYDFITITYAKALGIAYVQALLSDRTDEEVDVEELQEELGVSDNNYLDQYRAELNKASDTALQKVRDLAEQLSQPPK